MAGRPARSLSRPRRAALCRAAGSDVPSRPQGGRRRATPACPQAKRSILMTADGERLIAWHVPPDDDGPVVLYFHGNGGALNLRADRFRRLMSPMVSACWPVSIAAMAARREARARPGLIIDAEAAYALHGRYAAERLVLWGESLGTGVAVAIGGHASGRAHRPGIALHIDRRCRLRHLSVRPVRWLMKDRFCSDPRIGKMSCAGPGRPWRARPGGADRARRAAVSDDRGAQAFFAPPEAAHNDHESHAEMAEVRRFIRDGLNLAD